MNDATFKKYLGQLVAARKRYAFELKRCEDEYEKRFGSNPSDWDDDFWIDSFHLCGGNCDVPTMKKIVDSAVRCRNIMEEKW